MFGWGKNKKLFLQHKENLERRKQLLLSRGYLIEDIQGEGFDLEIEYKKDLVIPLWAEIFSGLDADYSTVNIMVMDMYGAIFFYSFCYIFQHDERFGHSIAGGHLGSGIVGSDIDIFEKKIIDTAENIDLKYFLEKSIEDANIAEANGGLIDLRKRRWQTMLDHLH